VCVECTEMQATKKKKKDQATMPALFSRFPQLFPMRHG